MGNRMQRRSVGGVREFGPGSVPTRNTVSFEDFVAHVLGCQPHVTRRIWKRTDIRVPRTETALLRLCLKLEVSGCDCTWA